MRIVLDAMGSDSAPKVEIEGAIQAIQEYGYEIVLVGDEAVIKSELSEYKYDPAKITLIHAPERIAMNEPAALSVRRKRHSSIVIGMDLLKRDEADEAPVPDEPTDPPEHP